MGRQRVAILGGGTVGWSAPLIPVSRGATA